MSTTISSRLLGNGVASALAVAAQKVQSMMRARLTRVRSLDAGSSGDEPDQGDLHERARLEAAARSTLAVLHQ